MDPRVRTIEKETRFQGWVCAARGLLVAREGLQDELPHTRRTTRMQTPRCWSDSALVDNLQARTGAPCASGTTERGITRSHSELGS